MSELTNSELAPDQPSAGYVSMINRVLELRLFGLVSPPQGPGAVAVAPRTHGAWP